MAAKSTVQTTRRFGPWGIAISTSNVLCSDGRRRTAYYTGEPDTFFSQPARVSVRGRTVSGHVYREDGEYHFTPYAYGKNANMLPPWGYAVGRD